MMESQLLAAPDVPVTNVRGRTHNKQQTNNTNIKQTTLRLQFQCPHFLLFFILSASYSFFCFLFSVSLVQLRFKCPSLPLSLPSLPLPLLLLPPPFPLVKLFPSAVVGVTAPRALPPPAPARRNSAPRKRKISRNCRHSWECKTRRRGTINRSPHPAALVSPSLSISSLSVSSSR